MRTAEYDIRRGPYAGYTVSAEAYRLPSGNWEVLLCATPWNPRLPEQDRVRHEFPDHGPAYDAVRQMEATMKEMSAGRYEENRDMDAVDDHAITAGELVNHADEIAAVSGCRCRECGHNAMRDYPSDVWYIEHSTAYCAGCWAER